MATTKKQAAANRENAKHSTGAVTEAGKNVVSLNAVRHGLTSQRLFLHGENPAEYHSLMDDLIASLKPFGTLELILVEKIATATWKQRRLIAAESASIELDRRMDRKTNRTEIEQAIGITWTSDSITSDDFKPKSDADMEQLEWCKRVRVEYENLPRAVLKTHDIEGLKKDAPLMYGQLLTEAEDEGMPLSTYVAHHVDMYQWGSDLYSWCGSEVAKLSRRELVQVIAEQVQARRTAPISHELMLRYQAALDGELYKAIRALREQQEWRMKSGMDAVAA